MSKNILADLENANSILRRRIIPLIQALVVFIISFSVLYAGENVGLSDNGDFGRVFLSNNIEYIDDTNSRHLFNQYYHMKLEDEHNIFNAMYSAWQTNEEEEIYSSPHFLIIKLSKELNIISNAITGKPLSDYNIAYMAFLYIFMLSLAAWVIFTFFADSKIKIQAAVFVLFIFIFCDAGYLLYFNSFYGEPLQYTALMMLIAFGMLIYKRPSVPKTVGFFVSLYFFAGAKLANIPYSLLVAFLGLFITMMRKDKKFKMGVMVSGLICIISIISLYNSIPDWMTRDTTYQAVFFGMVKESKNPEKDLEELNVPAEYAVLANTHAYMELDEYAIDITSAEFNKNFYENVSKADIAVFYLKHPVKLIKELSRAIENSAYIRPPSLGNSMSELLEKTDKYSSWSNIRVKCKFLYEPWVIFLVFITITLYMIFINIFYIYNHKIETPKRRYMICALDMLILGLWINLVLPIAGNGEADLAKHMFLFTNCIDILFVVFILGAVISPIKKLVLFFMGLAVFTGIFYIKMPSPTVEFGCFNGKKIEWKVLKRNDDGSFILITKDCVGYMPFDEDTNSWESSDLRYWLNHDFLMEFTQEELNKIHTVSNSVLLTYDEKNKAEYGNHAHYWNFTPNMVGNLSETAYQHHVSDMVFIPTLDLLKNIDCSSSFWVLCPYAKNSFMARFMNEDGFILYTDVKKEKGIRAVIMYK